MEFKGVSSPEVYVLDYKPHDEDLEAGYPLSGQRGAFVCSLLGSMSLLSEARFANWLGQSAEVVEQDILQCNPKVIVGFGSELMKIFVDTGKRITDVSGEVYDIKIAGQEFKYLVMMSPSYILQRVEDQELTLRFSQDLYKAFQIINGEYVDVLKEKEILSAHSYDEFREIYDSRFADSLDIAYDIETNARPIFAEDSAIIGFSIGNKSSGVYVSIDSLDFHMPPDEVKRIWDFMINDVFEKKNKLIIHNTMYERPYTYYCQGYEIKYEKADDTLVMARLLRGAKEGAGLKFQTQKNLHYPDWETDLSKYIQGFRGLVERVGLGPKKFAGVWAEIKENGVGVFDLMDTEAARGLSEEDYEEVNDLVKKLHSTVVDLYSESEIKNLGYLISAKVIHDVEQGGIRDSTIPYDYIPDRVLSKYGAVDSLATFDLRDYFFDMMERESTEKINLRKGYEGWLEQMYVAYIMERNGMYWDEDLVQRDREFLTSQATDCLRSMLKSPLFKPMIRQSCESAFKPIIFSDYLPMIPASQGWKVDYSSDTGKYLVYFQGKRVAKGRIEEISIPRELEHQYLEILEKLFYEEVDKGKDYEELKWLYNPASSTSADIPRRILLTDDLQMGGRINNLHTLAVSPEFEDLIDQLPIIDRKFLKMATTLHEDKGLREAYGEEWAYKRKEFYQGFCTMWQSMRGQVQTPEIAKILNEKVPVVIESFDDSGIIDIYHAYIVTGIDQDDRKTWTPEFEWMINFRLFKKSQKLVSSYIDGTVGRQNVVVVDRGQLESGETRMARKRYYFDGRLADDNEGYLVASKWSPNTAETGRWRSAFHTIPWGSQVKKYYSSRFKGGCTCCPDYSQMEVRTLAAVSHDKNMLDLFARGDDFHTQTAAQVWQKPVEEVTTAERRFSKTATFSLLYGAMEKSFANSYCNGDMAMAEKIYGGFFRAYPSVQEWIKERHEEVERDHRISLELSHRFIPIVPEGDGVGAINAMHRKSQNYPIQGSSADLVSGVVFDLQRYIEENNMKSLLFMSVHDSIEFDIYPYELLQFIEKMKFILNDSPMKRMGLPSKADVALGRSLGHEIEMEDIECNEDYTEAVLHLKGFKDEIYETCETWREAYKTVEIYDEEWKENYVSMGDLFILRKAFTPTLGTMRYKGTCKVRIKYYN